MVCPIQLLTGIEPTTLFIVLLNTHAFIGQHPILSGRRFILPRSSPALGASLKQICQYFRLIARGFASPSSSSQACATHIVRLRRRLCQSWSLPGKQFPAISSSWKKVYIGHIYQVNAGNSHQRTAFFRGGMHFRVGWDTVWSDRLSGCLGSLR